MIESTCAFCEYFDGGGLVRVTRARDAGADPVGGDCLNRRSPRFETTSADTCPEFYQDTTFEDGRGDEEFGP